MTTALTYWEPYILPEVAGLPDSAFLMAIRDAAIDFCRDTLIWKEWLTRISVAADDDDYSLTVPAAFTTYATIEGVYQVYYKENGADDDQFTLLEPTTEDEMEAELGGAWMFGESEQPSKYYISPSEPTTLYLYPIPTIASTSGLLVRAYFVPLHTATVLPDFLYPGYVMPIKYRALYKLFGMKAMPWYDPNEQAKNDELYQNEKDNLIVSATKGPIRKELAVRNRSWI